jgi:transketolase
MNFFIPKISENLTQDQIFFLNAFSKSCRRTIIEMLKNSQSGHPGGSLSSIDFLSIIYAFILSQTGEKIVISNGHISPAVYSVLAELGYISKTELIKNFRKVGSIFEGHITRHVNGVFYGTGPLGIGGSVASAFALGNKIKQNNEKVFCIMGDGEAQEGQVYEMINFAKQYKLDNLILCIDYNKVQLTESLESIMNLNLAKIFEAAGWEVLETDGHDFQNIWQNISKAYAVKEKPIVLLCNTIMGKGVPLMESDGLNKKATWHGKAPNPEMSDKILSELTLNDEEIKLINGIGGLIKWLPQKTNFEKALAKVDIKIGEAIVYDSNTLTDCRTAYGKALLDLAKLNKNILALTADLRESVMTKFVHDELPDQHIECGIAEQNMLSVSGGLSLSGFIPFCSTFGAFMTSRAKDQARVNDINQTNVKMVATHCGLSVGEDGPTHQAIDDMGSFLGFFNTMIIEPADPNQTDRIIRYIASHYGNFYVRMGRHKFPIITKEDGSPFYDKDYIYEYGKSDLIRKGESLTIVASGAMVTEALKARNILLKTNPKISIEIIAVSSIKKFDNVLINSIQKTKKVLTIEDHNTFSGLGGQLSRHIIDKNLNIQKFVMLGVEKYQLSGTSADLYKKTGLDGEGIAKKILEII